MRRSRIMKLVAEVSSSRIKTLAPDSSASAMAAACEVEPLAFAVEKAARLRAIWKLAEKGRQVGRMHGAAVLGPHLDGVRVGDHELAAVVGGVVPDPQHQGSQQGRLAVVSAADDQRHPGRDTESLNPALAGQVDLDAQRVGSPGTARRPAAAAGPYRCGAAGSPRCLRTRSTRDRADASAASGRRAPCRRGGATRRGPAPSIAATTAPLRAPTHRASAPPADPAQCAPAPAGRARNVPR